MGGTAKLMKLGELNSFDDREAKPQNLGLHIGITVVSMNRDWNAVFPPA